MPMQREVSGVNKNNASTGAKAHAIQTAPPGCRLAHVPTSFTHLLPRDLAGSGLLIPEELDKHANRDGLAARGEGGVDFAVGSSYQLLAHVSHSFLTLGHKTAVVLCPPPLLWFSGMTVAK